MRADPRKRPAPHACCPSASALLFTTSFVGRWAWRIRYPKTVGILVIHCPWCGVELSTQPAPLKVVR
jgi:hypothetical protein